MNKREAKRIAEAGVITVGELRHMIKLREGDGGMSKVNPQFPLERVLEIYGAALDSYCTSNGWIAETKPPGMVRDHFRNRDVPSKFSLTARNILRDCAP